MSRLNRTDLITRGEPERPPPPLGQRVAAFDLGERRIGVAVTDPNGGFVALRTTIVRRSEVEDRRVIGRIFDEHQVEIVVIGLPLNADGSEGAQASSCREWSSRLFQDWTDDVVWENEHLTSDMARQMGAVAEAIDATAAELLLRSFLGKSTRC